MKAVETFANAPRIDLKCGVFRELCRIFFTMMNSLIRTLQKMEMRKKQKHTKCRYNQKVVEKCAQANVRNATKLNRSRKCDEVHHLTRISFISTDRFKRVAIV